ncbi:MAG: rRNA cytosine-C5-methylase [Sneathiella sp.]|nr:MAG: rRNA cytosine-C5-methylase [Sneathiella sp.]
MTPSARLAAAVELLDATAATTAAAEHEVRRFFRTRRYAGSKDRRWVSEFVYRCLRRQGELDWRLECVDAETAPRMRALLALVLFDDEALDGLAASFFGGPHGLSELTDAEVDLLGKANTVETDNMPDYAAGNFPEWIAAQLTAQYGEKAAVIMAVYQNRAPVTLRVNLLKTTREAVVELLTKDGIEVTQTTYSPDGLVLTTRHNISRHQVLENGLVELQDEAAQISARLADVSPGQTVVDFCTGAGGKSLAMASVMQNQGQIYAFDINARRMRDMGARKRRASVDIIEPVELKQDDSDVEIFDRLGGTAQRVFVDAPCSGSGTWRRQPDQKWKLTPARLEELCDLQAGILDKAQQLVAPGGRLIYATCSILDQENQDQVSAFLQRHPGFKMIPVRDLWANVGLGGKNDDDVLRLTPADFGSDGFFTAVLQRDG